MLFDRWPPGSPFCCYTSKSSLCSANTESIAADSAFYYTQYDLTGEESMRFGNNGFYRVELAKFEPTEPC